MSTQVRTKRTKQPVKVGLSKLGAESVAAHIMSRWPHLIAAASEKSTDPEEWQVKVISRD